MKKNMLFKPLINSVLVLALFSLLLYLIVGNPEATVWSSFMLIVTGIFKTIQWVIAMTLALLACLAFLIAIFLGAVALFDRETAANMYRNLKTLLLSWLLPFTGQCCCSTSAQSSTEEVKAEAETLAAEQKSEAMTAEINSIQEHLHTTGQALTDKIDQITSRIDSLETMTTDMVNKKQLDDVSHEVQGAVDSLAGIQSAVSAMQSCIDQTESKLLDISPDKILGDLPHRVQTLEEQQSAAETPEPVEPVDITPLQNDINVIQSELVQIKEKADKALQAARDNTAAPVDQVTQAVQAAVQEAPESTQESTPSSTTPAASAPPVTPTTAASEDDQKEHRIFSYFDDPADKEKLAELVASTLDKDMSYKHALNYITKELGSVKGEVISSHPSLSKDYIRQCRKNH